MDNKQKVVLKEEFDYFMANFDEFIKKYEGKHLVIKDKQVLGFYDTFEDAIIETQKTEPLGTFLVQKCDADKNSYSQTFHSRVAFVV
jgi:hypothetical protein